MAANEFAAKLGIRAGQHIYLERLTGLVVRRELR